MPRAVTQQMWHLLHYGYALPRKQVDLWLCVATKNRLKYFRLVTWHDVIMSFHSYTLALRLVFVIRCQLFTGHTAVAQLQ